jgi:(2Fe-2S) ferredoxin
MSYYRHHVFFCTNRRGDDADRPSCALCGSDALRSYAKARLKILGLAGAGGVRANTAGCLDRCEEGPVMVVYPEGVWYTYLDESDIDEIIERHLIGGEVVERLRLPDQPVTPPVVT